MPAIGARENGVKGFAAGMVGGMAAGVVLPVAGAVGGLVQIGRGAVQTPFSIAGALQGKEWDKEAGTWRHYSLPDEAKARRRGRVSPSSNPNPDPNPNPNPNPNPGPQ